MYSSVDTHRPHAGGYSAGTDVDRGEESTVRGGGTTVSGEVPTVRGEEPTVSGDDPTVWTATGHESPVFLDHHGRRRRWVLAGGTLAGAAASLWLVALIAGAIGFATLPSWQAYHRYRVGRQPQALRADRDVRRGQTEARATGGPTRLPVVLRSRQLPRGETS
jgi:hypothetical protein